jgi:hypothetical protein
MPAARSLILCADDFGDNAENSLAILQLVEAERLSAVSAFTDAPLWRELGPQLEALGERAFLGLHFNLTRPFGYGERALVQRIAASLMRRIDLGQVRDACRRQLDKFVAVTGRLPDFIDGHEHVHAFPGIRDVVAELAADNGRRQPIPIRDVRSFFGRSDAPFKRRVIRFLATAGAPPGTGTADRGRPARPFNTGFAGDYSLKPGANYPALFEDWLLAAPDGSLIMCHPRLGDEGAPSAGQLEYQFLRSRAAAELFERTGARLARPANDSPADVRLT